MANNSQSDITHTLWGQSRKASCPFCGNDDIIDCMTYEYRHKPTGPVLYSGYMKCRKCHAQGPMPSRLSTSPGGAFNLAEEAWCIRTENTRNGGVV